MQWNPLLHAPVTQEPQAYLEASHHCGVYRLFWDGMTQSNTLQEKVPTEKNSMHATQIHASA